MELSNLSILVTGGGGFLGSHLVDKLNRLGCKEIFAPTSQDCDLLEPAALNAYLAERKPNLIFHLAAQVGGIGANARNPASYFHDNMVMGINVLEQARLARIEKTLMVGTICSYPKFAPVPFVEDDLWSGYPEETNAPYGIAKKALFVMAEAYRRQYELNTVCLLPVNLYGPRDNFDLETSHVIPAMIRKFMDAKAQNAGSITLWGDGSPTREFLFVDDCADALILAAEKYNSSEPVNVGAGFEISIRDTAALIARLTAFQGDIHWDVSRPNGQPRRMLDTSRARDRFGFVADTTFEEGLKTTIAWYTAQTCESIARPQSGVETNRI